MPLPGPPDRPIAATQVVGVLLRRAGVDGGLADVCAGEMLRVHNAARALLEEGSARAAAQVS